MYMAVDPVAATARERATAGRPTAGSRDGCPRRTGVLACLTRPRLDRLESTAAVLGVLANWDCWPDELLAATTADVRAFSRGEQKDNITLIAARCI
ncbi:MAG: hypothetical protein ACRD2E_03540 [Terriglobales bacterium]